MSVSDVLSGVAQRASTLLNTRDDEPEQSSGVAPVSAAPTAPGTKPDLFRSILTGALTGAAVSVGKQGFDAVRQVQQQGFENSLASQANERANQQVANQTQQTTNDTALTQAKLKDFQYQAALQKINLLRLEQELQYLPVEHQQRVQAANVAMLAEMNKMGLAPLAESPDDIESLNRTMEGLDISGMDHGKLFPVHLPAPKGQHGRVLLFDASKMQFNRTPANGLTVSLPSGKPLKIPGGIPWSLAQVYYSENSSRETRLELQERANKLRESLGLNEDASWNMSSLPVQLVEGNLDPSQLSKRAKTYEATLVAANQYSLQKYGKPFDIAQAQADYRFATTLQTQNTLRYLNSLTGHDNKSGNLGALIELSNKINRTKFPSLNDAQGWARIQTGDPQMAAFHAAAIETADQVAKILQGGSGSETSDAKLKQAADLFRTGFSKEQIIGVSQTLRELLVNRKTELIGSNRYLLKQFGHPTTSQTVQPLYANNPSTGERIVSLDGGKTWQKVQ